MGGHLRGHSPPGAFLPPCRGEKRQLVHRLPAHFVRSTLARFSQGALDRCAACSRLGIGTSRLYELRARWLKDPRNLRIAASGGDQHGPWPVHIIAFLREFLPLQRPPNFQLVSDELLRLHGFRRARSTIEFYVKAHLPHLASKADPRPRPYRRFRRARFGELWQHDSSIHQWWAAPCKQTLLLTLDDHSGFNIAGRFVARDTTWEHFCHFRGAFEAFGRPEAIYTDALSLFGPSSSSDNRDPRSEFQRALRRLDVAHLVAPTPQAKGKIERRFGTFQKRMLALLAHAKVRGFDHANKVLQMEIQRQNSKPHPSTGKPPAEIFELTSQLGTHALRPCPPSTLLDLHFSLRCSRRVNNDHTIEFDGQIFQIAPTLKRVVTVLFHPGTQLWVLEQMPTDIWPLILGRFSL